MGKPTKAEFDDLVRRITEASEEADKAKVRLKKIESFRRNYPPPNPDFWLCSISAEFETRSVIEFYQQRMIRLNQQLFERHSDRWKAYAKRNLPPNCD